MTHVTCRLAAKARDQLRNPTLGNRVWAAFTFYHLSFRRLAFCRNRRIELGFRTDTFFDLSNTLIQKNSGISKTSVPKFVPISGLGRFSAFSPRGTSTVASVVNVVLPTTVTSLMDRCIDCCVLQVERNMARRAGRSATAETCYSTTLGSCSGVSSARIKSG